MIRFFFGAVGSVLLAFAVVFAVADIARSLAEDVVRFTPLGQALASVGIDTAQPAGESQPVIDALGFVAGWPASAVLAAAAFLFLFVGQARARSDRLVR